MCRAYILCSQKVDAEYLMRLREMLMGNALNDERNSDLVFDALDEVILRVADFIQVVYGDDEAAENAKHELSKITSMDRNMVGLWSRRAAVLFAISRDVEVADHLNDDENTAVDLRDRVLPLITPLFVRHLCQRPKAKKKARKVKKEMKKVAEWT